MRSAWFDLIALTVIGIAALVAGCRLFRWDIAQKLLPSAKAWVAMAVVTWAFVGLAAEATGRLKSDKPAGDSRQIAKVSPATLPLVTTIPATAPIVETPATIPAKAPWELVTREQIDSIKYDDLPPDQGTVVPLAGDLNGLDDDGRKRMESFNDALADWPPGQVSDIAQRVRNLLSVCAVADIAEDQNEPQIPLIVFNYMRGNIQKDQLIKALTWIVLNDREGTVLTNIKDIKELAIDAEVPEESLRERAVAYAQKFLFRLLGKMPVKE